jgi:Cu-processing system ATP-binding protein
MISIKNLDKQYGRLKVLNQVSLDFESGKSYALMGPNGSGKTTLVKSILGLVIPKSGEILVNGISIRKQWKYRNDIGYMPQIGKYPENMRIGHLMDMMRNLRNYVTDTDDDLYKAYKLDSMQDKRIYSLSGGTKQKVSAALAFMFRPKMLILDEPTAGLDPISVEYLKEKIIGERQKGKLFIISSHILNDLDELTTEAIYLNEGNLIYNNSIANLKAETGEKKLTRAIANMMSINLKEETNTVQHA